jgi:hypothetical protein
MANFFGLKLFAHSRRRHLTWERRCTSPTSGLKRSATTRVTSKLIGNPYENFFEHNEVKVKGQGKIFKKVAESSPMTVEALILHKDGQGHLPTVKVKGQDQSSEIDARV